MQATLAYATLVLAGVSFQSTNSIPVEKCSALQVTHPQTLCIDVLPPCGVGEAELCLDQPKPKKHAVKRRVVRRR